MKLFLKEVKAIHMYAKSIKQRSHKKKIVLSAFVVT